jgi:hypothetical protein
MAAWLILSRCPDQAADFLDDFLTAGGLNRPVEFQGEMSGGFRRSSFISSLEAIWMNAQRHVRMR